MLESLTPQQIKLQAKKRDEWIDIALHRSNFDKEELEAGVKWMYYASNLKEPEVVFVEGPKEFAEKLVPKTVLKTKLASVRDSVWASVWDSVGASVGDSVWASVGDSGYGQHDAGWIGFYDFFRIVCGLKRETEKLVGLDQIIRSAGWFLPHKKLCWICERHHTVHRNAGGRLHKDGGPALEYPDGFAIWVLNGVRVKQCQAETPAEQMKPEDVLSETNTDVRRELIRKVGVERLLAKLPHKSLSKSGNYEVLSVNFPDLNDARYLRMLNPSVGCWHLEGVPREADTVEKALNYRAGNLLDSSDWKPEILT